MFTGRHRFAEESMRKFMDLFGQESDDVRNIANTKVNPFKMDKENEVVKYEPINPALNMSSNNRIVDKNAQNFLKLNDLEEGSDQKNVKIEKFYDPINNTLKIHAELVSKKTIEEEDEMEKSVKTNENDELKPIKSRPETPITYKPSSQNKLPSQTRLPTPKPQETKEINISKQNINSRPTSKQNNTSTLFNPTTVNRPNSGNINLNQSKNELNIENISRPGSSAQNNVDNPKDKSFVEIKKLEIEDLENSENDEDEKKSVDDNKTLNLSNENEKKMEPLKFKNNEDSNKFFNNFNNQFNLDQNRNKNTNLVSKNNVFGKDNQYQF